MAVIHEAIVLALFGRNEMLQAMIDGLIAQWQHERAQTQMTLGGLIAALEEMPGEALVEGLSNPHSYRGYYCDLAFEPPNGKTTAAEFLGVCRGAMGQVFQGYKGGDFMMGAMTPLWIASYGCCGRRIVGIGADGAFETTDETE